MKYKQIILCMPPFRGDIPIAPFAGVGYISEYLSANNIKHLVFDMNLGYSKKDFFDKIREFKPDLIGFFLMTYLYKESYKLINLVKRKYKITCVAGGPHVSTFRKEFLRECNADFAIKLEGENTLMDLINGKDPKEILGLIYRDKDEIQENQDRPFIRDLNTIPFPKYAKFEINKYKDRVIPIITSRGCPYQCIYCPINVAVGRQFRMRSAKNVFQEVQYWYNRGYKKIHFQDDNFTLIKKRVIDICRLIQRSNMKGLVLNATGVRADRVDKDVLNEMKKTGFKTIAFGVEGGNDKILKTLKKGETIKEIEEKIKLACEMGFDVALYFLIGSPGETPKDVEDSFKLALRYPIVDAFFYSIVPYPKTELYEWIKKNNLWLKPPSKYLNEASASAIKPFYQTKELPKNKRIELLKKAKKISHKIRKRGIIRRARERYGSIGIIIGNILGSNFADKYILQNMLFLRIYTKYLESRAKNLINLTKK